MTEPTPDSSRYLEEARMIAGHCWCDETTKHLVMVPELAEAFARRLAGWMDIAAQHTRNENFYRELLNKCADALGPVTPKVFIQDDGGVVDEPLRVKLPELIAELATLAEQQLKSIQKQNNERVTRPAAPAKCEHDTDGDGNCHRCKNTGCLYDFYALAGQLLGHLKENCKFGDLSLMSRDSHFQFQWNFKARNKWYGSQCTFHMAELIDEKLPELAARIVERWKIDHRSNLP